MRDFCVPFLNQNSPPWLCQIISCMGGCLGCFTKPRVSISTDEASKGLRPEDQEVRKDNRSDDLWWSSTSEMDRHVAESQRSIASVSISSRPSDPQSSAGVQIDHPEFINHGLLWNQIRQQWVGHRMPNSQKHVGELRISWDATYETIVGSNRRFPMPIPLAEIVDILVDIWELEGLYD